jgi:hypothetical protein
MSGFIGAALPQFGIAAKDQRLVPSFLAMKDARGRGGDRAVPANEGFYSGFWPGNRGFIGDMGAGVSMMAANGGRKTERIGAGMASRVGFPGVTRDQYGAPLAACTVILHRTATREFVYEGVSGTDGVFLAQSVYAGENHYIVFHKAGALNVYGATDNNLVGA